MRGRAEGVVPPESRVLFDAVLYPHRSLTRAGFWVLMGAVCAVSLAAGTVFLLAGAWPVFGFYGLDVVLLYLAFRLNFHRAKAHEVLRLTENELSVRRVSAAGKAESWTFPPYWLRVSLDDPPESDSPLVLSSHGRRLAIGGFLTTEERREVAEALCSALRTLREPRFLRAPGSPQRGPAEG